MAGLLDNFDLSGLLTGANGQGGLLGWGRDNSDALIGLGAGIASTPGWGAGIGAGLQGLQKGAMMDQARLKQRKADNATKAYLAAHPELDQATKDYAASNPDAAQAIFAKQLTPKQEKPQAEYGVIGEDAYGNKQYGWINPYTQEVKAAGGSGGVTSVGTPVMGSAPPGVDPRKWRELQTERASKQQQALEAGLQPGTDAFNNYMLGRPPVQQKPLTGEQSNAQGFAERMAQAEQVLSDPKVADVAASRWQSGLNAIPGVGNSLVSEDKQKLEQAKSNFITAQLRKESGAAISQGEFDTADRTYFPQPGDGPAVIRQKALLRQTAIENMRRAGSNAPGSSVQSTANGGKNVYTAPDGTTIEPLD